MQKTVQAKPSGQKYSGCSRSAAGGSGPAATGMFRISSSSITPAAKVKKARRSSGSRGFCASTRRSQDDEHGGELALVDAVGDAGLGRDRRRAARRARL